jgi:hypothetical protein
VKSWPMFLIPWIFKGYTLPKPSSRSTFRVGMTPPLVARQPLGSFAYQTVRLGS